jgi:hypothetical protein
MMGCRGFPFKTGSTSFALYVILRLPRITGAAMPDLKTLYDEDFVAWSKQQAEALRAAARAVRTNNSTERTLPRKSKISVRPPTDQPNPR